MLDLSQWPEDQVQGTPNKEALKVERPCWISNWPAESLRSKPKNSIQANVILTFLCLCRSCSVLPALHLSSQSPVYKRALPRGSSEELVEVELVAPAGESNAAPTPAASCNINNTVVLRIELCILLPKLLSYWDYWPRLLILTTRGKKNKKQLNFSVNSAVCWKFSSVFWFLCENSWGWKHQHVTESLTHFFICLGCFCYGRHKRALPLIIHETDVE